MTWETDDHLYHSVGGVTVAVPASATTMPLNVILCCGFSHHLPTCIHGGHSPMCHYSFGVHVTLLVLPAFYHHLYLCLPATFVPSHLPPPALALYLCGPCYILPWDVAHHLIHSSPFLGVGVAGAHHHCCAPPPTAWLALLQPAACTLPAWWPGRHLPMPVYAHCLWVPFILLVTVLRYFVRGDDVHAITTVSTWLLATFPRHDATHAPLSADVVV